MLPRKKITREETRIHTEHSLYNKYIYARSAHNPHRSFSIDTSWFPPCDRSSIMRATALNYITALLTLSPLAICGRPKDEFSFSCVPLTVQLSDPIMYPGTVSDHTHLVTGGTAFQRSMKEDTARKANGTTCGIDIDRSNYWVPHLYHRMDNGSFELMENKGIVCGIMSIRLC